MANPIKPPKTMPNIQVTGKSNMAAKMAAILGAEDNIFLYKNSNNLFFYYIKVTFGVSMYKVSTVPNQV
ncbi:MAG: hypothetical protein GY928_10255 [Colwellia sp.]|nr:hypothetical protein [Colwellia sp.]